MMSKDKLIARLKILSVKDNKDGTSVLTFDLDKEFIDWFNREEGLDKFSQERFEEFVQNALKGIERPAGFHVRGSISAE